VLDIPQVTSTPEQQYASIGLTVPRADIRSVMGPGVRELFATLHAQGIAPAGAWFTHHLRMVPEVFDFEIGVPVARPVAAAGRVRPGLRPAMPRVARAVMHGDYEGLVAAWVRFDAWISASGLRPAADLWESYVAGPESGSDPATWRTELHRPLLG
jgi:effector-binding domain-containing protein